MAREAILKAEFVYEFGRFRLDVKGKHLLRDNEPIPLNPKTFELLTILVKRSGQVVEKRELFQELWPDNFVEECNLTQNIYLLRKALGKDAGEDVSIKTVSGRGYRLIAEVRKVHFNDGPAARASIETLAPIRTEQAALEEKPSAAASDMQRNSISSTPPPVLSRPAKIIIGSLILICLLLLAHLLYINRTRPPEENPGPRVVAVAVHRHQ